MAVQLSALLGVALTVGGILLAIGAAAGFWIGRAASDPGGIQARATVRELQSLAHQRRRQLAAARDEVGALLLHPTTHGHTRAVLVDRLQPLLTERTTERPR